MGREGTNHFGGFPIVARTQIGSFVGPSSLTTAQHFLSAKYVSEHFVWPKRLSSIQLGAHPFEHVFDLCRS